MLRIDIGDLEAGLQDFPTPQTLLQVCTEDPDDRREAPVARRSAGLDHGIEIGSSGFRMELNEEQIAD